MRRMWKDWGIMEEGKKGEKRERGDKRGDRKGGQNSKERGDKTLVLVCKSFEEEKCTFV